MFDGELLMTFNEIVGWCTTRVAVESHIIFGCPLPPGSAHRLNVNINQTVKIKAEYLSPNTSGSFYHCVGIRQNGNYAETSFFKINF